MPSPRVAITVAAVAIALASLTSCKEEDTRLFDEAGVWTLEKYSLEGMPYQDIDQGRKNRFLLRFKPDDGVVAAAACHEQGTDIDVNSSTCVNAGLSTWSCQCFAYTYEESTMIWQEFAPGEPPPVVGIPSGDGGTGDTGGTMEGDSHDLSLSSFGDLSATYEFHSLPMGLFNSDGDLAKHVFQIKADTVWTEVDLNDDGVPDLEACSQSCFPSEAASG
ncbi:hypothetical protein ENSA5_46570 [Enhygromyxa salina]|uniref:Lipoprotein n=1 Tax=Enhygromyxa salina TaxID=215803 RepID=A0A2S9XJM5_9BACT|nr:hypothetical protein [Enhygromyxa salina]PRP92891.1 hypothetical protein ENSA5_46570 [Enhygromyxa salina]